MDPPGLFRRFPDEIAEVLGAVLSHKLVSGVLRVPVWFLGFLGFFRCSSGVSQISEGLNPGVFF